MGAMLRFKRAIGHDVSKLDSGKIEELLTFVHCCIASACNVDRIEFGLTVEEMADNIEPDALNAFYDGISSPVAGETDPEKNSSPGVTELLAIAVGDMGMTVADFCELTPEEFSEALTIRQRPGVRRAGGGERARMMCMCILQPYAKNPLKPTDVMQFPWEAGERGETARRAPRMRRRWPSLSALKRHTD